MYKLFLFCVWSIYPVSNFDYCNITCSSLEHTMCLYPNNEPGSACGDFYSSLISKSNREEILDSHNFYRNQIASGYGKFPPASNMLELYWDVELEIIAQRHADQCKFEKSYCVDVNKFKVNQNIAQIAQIEENAPSQRDLVDTIFEEMNECTLDTIRNFTNTSNLPIHAFTQAIWAETNRIGCGEVRYKVETYIKYFLVCNYGPKGNQPGVPVYKEGKPCTGCKNHTTCGINKNYKNLCGDHNAPAVPEKIELDRSRNFAKSIKSNAADSLYQTNLLTHTFSLFMITYICFILGLLK